MTRLVPDPMEPAEAEIFLRALREYSESCRAPELHPDCPFAVETSDGRGCGEQCMDLLAANGAPPPVEEVYLGHGIGTRPRRPKPRSGPSPTARAYDASEQWFEDRETMDRSKWRTPSLLFDLKQQVTMPPDASRVGHTDRAAAIELAGRELERRGFDVELLVRDGCGPEIACGIVFATVMASVIEAAGSGDVDVESPAIAEWRGLLGPVDHDLEIPPTKLGAKTLIAYLPQLIRWLTTADLRDLVNWTAPRPTDWMPAVEVPVPGPTRWLVERFTRPYLADWSTESLRLEWRYIHSATVPLCPAREMRARRVDESELAKVLSDRFVEETGVDVDLTEARSHVGSVVLNANIYVPKALELLKAGNRSGAASLFEAAIALNENDAAAHNNLGFCLLLDKPDEALLYLERAQELRFGSRLINIANRLFALRALGRYATAMELADLLDDSWDEVCGQPDTGYLWVSIDGTGADAELRFVEDVRLYILAIVQSVAELSGASLAEQWAHRARRLRKAAGSDA